MKLTIWGEKKKQTPDWKLGWRTILFTPQVWTHNQGSEVWESTQFWWYSSWAPKAGSEEATAFLHEIYVLRSGKLANGQKTGI